MSNKTEIYHDSTTKILNVLKRLIFEIQETRKKNNALKMEVEMIRGTFRNEEMARIKGVPTEIVGHYNPEGDA